MHLEFLITSPSDFFSTDKLPGDKVKLMDLHKRVSAYPSYGSLCLSNPALVDEMLEALTEHKRELAVSTRMYKSSHAQDITATCKKLETEVSLLCIACILLLTSKLSLLTWQSAARPPLS